MTFSTVKALFFSTLTDPRRGGREVIALNLPTQGLWLALMLMAVILSLLISGLLQLVPIAEGELSQVVTGANDPSGQGSPLSDEQFRQFLLAQPAFQSPILFAILNWVQSVITVYILHWISRMVGGEGELRDMLAVIVWLQIMSLLLGVICALVSIILPPIGSLGLLLAFFWGLWAIVAVVDAASRFDSMFRALGVCIAGFLAFSFISTVIGSVLLAFGVGGIPNV